MWVKSHEIVTPVARNAFCPCALEVYAPCSSGRRYDGSVERRMPKILDGAAIAAAIKQEVAEEVKLLAAQGVRPGLAAVLVGHVPASEIYVRSKVQTCADLGISSDLITPPESVTTEEMLGLVAGLNARDEIDGILIQLPLPAHVDAKALLDAVSPAKDVDGFNPVNASR